MGGGSAREYGGLPNCQDPSSLKPEILFTKLATSTAGISLVLSRHGSQCPLIWLIT